MKRYIAQFAHSPNHYVVLDTIENCTLGEPRPYHEANDEAQARNDGTWGKPTDQEAVAAFSGWFTVLPGRALIAWLLTILGPRKYKVAERFKRDWKRIKARRTPRKSHWARNLADYVKQRSVGALRLQDR